MTTHKRIHPAVLDAASDMRKGKMSRRGFLRFATLLGASVPVAYALAGCAPEATAPAAGSGAAESGAAAAPAAGGIVRGGTLRVGMLLQQIDHPARMSWVEAANVVRHVGEYLTETGPDNLTRPYLLESWEANDDVTEWTLNLQQGIKFNNGDDLTADDVMFTMSQWLDEDIGSSMLGLLSYLDGMNSVEKVDDHTIKLHLSSGNIGVPEHLFHYPAIILHRNFEGDFLQQPIGTGPFTLAEYNQDERAVLQARSDYWRNGEDGNPLPYLDEIVYVNLDKDSTVAAMLGGQVDSIYNPGPSQWQAMNGAPDFTIRPASTAQTIVLRMRVDLEPWDDNRVRNALKMCQDREDILRLSYFGEGDLAIDAHVAPVHPAYAEKPIPPYDPDGARALLEEYAAEKGIELPLQVTLATKNDQSEPEIAQALKEQAAPAGFEISLDITEPGGYWDRWTEVDLGLTSWTHRPLDTMVLPLAYTEEAIGNWNETRWVDDEFETLLRQAEGALDIEARRELMSQIEDIMQERGPIGIAYWRNVWNITRSGFQNVKAHPTSYDLFYDVWKEDA
ncbi:MAG: ABC transporter substrate-binding protein [Caldilineaceae bacterium]|nr:ABC transporter substrate-binding protein [Caldilineaceae bacterium]